MTSAQKPPAGWYPTGTGNIIRWWNGKHWNGVHLRDGVVRSNSFAVTPPAIWAVVAFMFALQAALQLILPFSVSYGPISSRFLFGGILLACALAFLAFTIMSASVRSAAPPRQSAVGPSVVRPLPWEQEGAGAGWYPVTNSIQRYWTGARWSNYVIDRTSKIIPVLNGERILRNYTVVAWSFFGLAVLSTLASAVTLIVMSLGGGSHNLFGAILWLIVSFVLAITGAMLLLTKGIQRRVFVAPSAPPTQLQTPHM